MDHSRFQDAQLAYDAGDFRGAAKLFLASAGRGAEGNGGAYHMSGNCLMRLRRHSDAIAVYAHALRDETYGKRGAIYANLGAAHVALGDLSEALDNYHAALDEPDYTTPYKAWQGIASIQMDRGRVEEAAVAYRRAALDEGNPNPAKSLVNFGLCLMALGRPKDAVDAYQAALGFEEYDGRGKALANLGQAHFALGQYKEAVKAFQKSTQLHGHVLSKAAEQAYETALAETTPAAEIVDGWETGEMPAAVYESDDESHDAYSGDVEEEAPDEDHTVRASRAAEDLGFGDENAVNDFFSMTEEEMKVRAREARRADSGAVKSRLIRRVILSAVAVVAIVALVVGGYFAGFGWPTQQSVVSGMFGAYAKGDPVESYWVAVPNTDVKREMAKIPPVKDFTVDEVTRGRTVSSANVTVTPRQGAVMHYTVKLAREGVGWRVIGLDYNWSSSGE